MSPIRITVIATAVVAVAIGYLVAGRPVPAPGAVVFPATTTTVAVDTAVDTAPDSIVPTPTTQPTIPPTSAPLVTAPDDDNGESIPAELVDRSALRVGVGNANGVVGSAGSLREALVGSGYSDVTAFDARSIADVSVVFHANGLRDEAARLAVDAGLDADATAPAALSPVDLVELDVDLVVVLGLDRP